MSPRITLEQWQALVAVVDAGGYAQAAEQLHKSQSSVTYLVQKLESLLGLKAFAIKGRKAALTPHGQLLYRRARVLLDEAAGIESAAKSASVRSKDRQFGIGCSIQPKTISAPSRCSSTGMTPATVSILSNIFDSGPPSTNAEPRIG